MSFLFFLILAVTIPLSINLSAHLATGKPLWALSKPFYQFVLWFQKTFQAAAPVMMGILLMAILNISWEEGAWFVSLMTVVQIFFTARFYRGYFRLKGVDFTTAPTALPVGSSGTQQAAGPIAVPPGQVNPYYDHSAPGGSKPAEGP